MPRILIADDNPRVRRYVHEVLEDEGGWEVCGEAGTGREAVGMTLALKPDIVVLDLSMPELNGLQAAQETHRAFPGIEILILSMHDVPELIDAALASGVRAFLMKHDLDGLLDAVRSALQDPVP